MIDIIAPGSDDNVVTVDVYDANNNTLLAAQTLTRYDFNVPMTYQVFPLAFTSAADATLEFRVYWHQAAYINVDKVTVEL
jgi:hypothetical protein